jgi:thioredoxin 1
MAVVELNAQNFEGTIKDNAFVIVDYWAPWCGPCRSFAPVFEKVSEDHPDVVFAKVNTEDEQQIAAHFQIRSIPTLMIFRDQIIIFSQPGALPEGPSGSLSPRPGSSTWRGAPARSRRSRRPGLRHGDGACVLCRNPPPAPRGVGSR